MQAILLGTGCPVVHPERGGAATLIVTDNAKILIDCGSGVTRRLVEMGLKSAEIDALLITHFHTDHLVDFYQLVISSWHQGRLKPWRIYAPRPVLDHIGAVMKAWEAERDQRTKFEQRTSTAGLEIEPVEIAGGDTFKAGDIDVTTVDVDHGPVVPAFGFVFRADGQTIVHSGDTAHCPALIEAGQGADLLIHEVMLHRDPPKGLSRSSKTMDNVASYHTLSSEVGGIARDMDARILALTHFVPPEFEHNDLIAEVGETFDGPILIGEDLMRIDLSSRVVSWRHVHQRIL